MKYNFCAGPCTLAKEVFEQASQAVVDFNGTGLSILEISHRSQEFDAVLFETEQLLRELMQIPANYSVLFMQGGASAQFALVPMNLLPVDGKAAYLDTGVWASKAIQEAARIGKVDVVASSADRQYQYIPKDFRVPEDAAYFHFTSNNTIYGTELFDIPDTKIPVVADMSSDILSRVIQVDKYDLIYAGAQKNLGTAGLTVVIVKNEILGNTGKIIPNIFNYQQHAAAGSRYHTPPVFPIYVSLLNLRWLKAQGGVAMMEQQNIVKARVLYEEIDRNSLFRGTADVADRSRMNVSFVANHLAHEAEFLSFAGERNLVELKGHRSVGGFRASIYNALGISGVNALVDAMQEFEDQKT